MILSYNNFLLERERRDVSLFTPDEKDLFEDLLQEYIDRYSMVEMPQDFNEMHFFDETIPRIQYLIQRSRNMGIDIECNSDISLIELYNELLSSFMPRLEKYGYVIMYKEFQEQYDTNSITIVVTKEEGYTKFKIFESIHKEYIKNNYYEFSDKNVDPYVSRRRRYGPMKKLTL